MKEHFPYLFWAYNIIWILITVYLGVIFARQRSIRRQIEELERRLNAMSQAGPGARRVARPGEPETLDGKITG